MITRNSTLAFLCLSSSIFAAETEFKNSEEKFSYLIGRNIGNSLLHDGAKVETESLLVGIRDALSKRESQISDEEAEVIFQENYDRLAKEHFAEVKAIAQKSLAKGEAFLAKNGKGEGVITTKSGLQYEVISEGKGAKPLEKDYVLTQLHGTLINGVVFESTVDSGHPGDFRIDQVIPGLQEALQLMSTGAKFKVYLPAVLGFGEQGSGELIGPNEVLIYEIELLEIQKRDKKVSKPAEDKPAEE